MDFFQLFMNYLILIYTISYQRISIVDGGGVEKHSAWQPKFIIYSNIKKLF